MACLDPYIKKIATISVYYLPHGLDRILNNLVEEQDYTKQPHPRCSVVAINSSLSV